MKVLNLGKDVITASLSKEELGFLCNTINETIEAIGGWEFPIRTGWKEDEAKSLLNSLSDAYEALKAAS